MTWQEIAALVVVLGMISVNILGWRILGWRKDRREQEQLESVLGQRPLP
jgi:hypothetical protein